MIHFWSPIGYIHFWYLKGYKSIKGKTFLNQDNLMRYLKVVNTLVN